MKSNLVCIELDTRSNNSWTNIDAVKIMMGSDEFDGANKQDAPELIEQWVHKVRRVSSEYKSEWGLLESRKFYLSVSHNLVPTEVAPQSLFFCVCEKQN